MQTICYKACNFVKKENPTQLLSLEFVEISKNTCLQNTSGQLLLIGNNRNHCYTYVLAENLKSLVGTIPKW